MPLMRSLVSQYCQIADPHKTEMLTSYDSLRGHCERRASIRLDVGRVSAEWSASGRLCFDFGGSELQRLCFLKTRCRPAWME